MEDWRRWQRWKNETLALVGLHTLTFNNGVSPGILRKTLAQDNQCPFLAFGLVRAEGVAQLNNELAVAGSNNTT
jgi:hypothetical protein